ncbi:SDR family oxidoreductase [Saccharopolyspora sp. ASAGF58]|nr:SDR family oxidoreductase [Saccharopolyspora sp. ASAGF58]
MIEQSGSRSRTALVTGASRGIGFAIAERMATRGYSLSITARRKDKLDDAAAELRGLGAPEVRVEAADSADRDALTQVVGRHEAAFGSLDALVINAGVGTAGAVEAINLRRLDKMLEVNFVAAVVLIKASMPLLRKAAKASNGSRIIAISSITGAYAEPNLAVYGASKAALMSLIETLNTEETVNGISATAIAPAFVDTDMSTWARDVVSAESMIPTSDVVRVVEMLLDLSPRSVISKLIMARAGTRGYRA